MPEVHGMVRQIHFLAPGLISQGPAAGKRAGKARSGRWREVFGRSYRPAKKRPV